METIPTQNRLLWQKAGDGTTGLLTYTSPVVMNFCLLGLRWLAGILLFIVGSGKLFGWFGGYGLQPSLLFYAKMGFAPWLAYLSIFTECFGVLLAFGLVTRPVNTLVIFLAGPGAYSLDSIIIKKKGGTVHA